ncbi:hypothetical protein G6F56_013028 [Rhizopus delemar]|nr:hypothetical protein G6F56_013028 [Rhizopus delemar]
MSRKYHGIAKVIGDVDVATLAPPAQLDLNTDMDFGPSTSPAMTDVPTWFAPVQAQLARQELRLSQVEEVLAENQRLRADLELANQRIRELEFRLGEPNSIDLTTPSAMEFPPMGTAASKYAPPAPPTIPEHHKESFAAAATRGQKEKQTAPPNTPVRRRKGLTSRQRQVLVRNFTPMTENQGYTYLYLPNRFRERISVMRKKLRQLKLDNGRILDVHYPDNKVLTC